MTYKTIHTTYDLHRVWSGHTRVSDSAMAIIIDYASGEVVS